MLHSTFILSLLAGAAVAQLSESNLKTYVGSLSLSASFNPIKESYWTGLPHHRRTPFAVSPDGKSAYLAYLDASETDVHVQQVDPSTFAAVGQAVTVTGGKEAGGLVAHNDGFALLTNEAMPSGTANAPADSTPVAVLYRYTAGKQTFKTWLGGPSNPGSMGNLASPDMNGDLAYSEASGMYGAYFVVTAYSGSAQGHFGDAIQYVDETGTLKQIQGASSSWGCSHNTGIAFEAADSVPFASLCSEDQGAIWLNTGATGMDKSGVKVSNENVQNGAGNEAMGGMSGSYSGLARFIGSDSYIFSWVSRGAKNLSTNEWMGAGYTKAENRTVNRNVAIATFSDKKTLNGEQATSTLGGDGDSQVNWITQGSADCQNAHVAAFDGTNALVTWEEIANPTCEFIAMGCKGAFTGSYFQLVNNGKKVGTPVKSMDVFVAGDMVTMSDGRVCWPYVDMDWKLDGPVSNPASVKAISFACMGMDGAGSGDSPATPASSTQATSQAPAATSAAPVQSSAAASQPAAVSEVAESTGLPTAIETPAPTTAPETPVESSLPTFELITSGATVTPPTTSAPVAASTSLPVDDDQPAPYESIQVPASESFNPTEAPAFTESIETPIASVAPEYSSTPCSSVVTPTEVPSGEEGAPSESPSTTAAPVETPAPGPEEDDDVPCPEDDAEATGTPLDATAPIPTDTAVPTAIPTELPPFPTGSAPAFPPFPTGTARPSRRPHFGRPGYGWGRPRPSGFWPSRGYPRPTGGFGFGPRPSAGFEAEKFDFGLGKSAAKSTPCGFETRVRPTATAEALVR
ncbi:Nn.00g062360.m01.CDS01 [Neocucurbitaria sp. VM-36]